MPTRGLRLLLAAMLIDTLGSGMFGPFELLYGPAVVGVPLRTAGLALSAATGAAILVGPAAGWLVDRIGASGVIVTGNALAAAGCVGLLVAGDTVGFAAASFLLAAASRTFWAAFVPLVGEMAPPAGMDRWFGWLRAARYAGLTAGAAAASVALLAGRQTGLRLVVAGDGASYLITLTLVLAAHSRRRATTVNSVPVSDQQDGGGTSSYRLALRDRGNVTLALLNIVNTLLVTAPLLAMPVFVLDRLHLESWLPGTLAAVGTAAVAGPTLLVARLGHGRSRLRVLAAANLLWVLGCLLFAGSAVPSLPAAPIAATAPLAPSAPLAATGLLILAMTMLGLGEAAFAPTGDMVAVTIAPPGQVGRYTALHQLAWGVSGTVAPALTAALLTLGSYPIWFVLAGLALVNALAYVGIGPALDHRTGRIGVASYPPPKTGHDDTGVQPRPPPATSADRRS